MLFRAMFVDVSLNYKIELTQLAASSAVSNNSTHVAAASFMEKKDLNMTYLYKLKEILRLLKQNIPSIELITRASSNINAFSPACVNYISYLSTVLSQRSPSLNICSDFTISPDQAPLLAAVETPIAQDTLVVSLSASILSVSPGKEFRAPLNFPLLPEVSTSHSDMSRLLFSYCDRKSIDCSGALNCVLSLGRMESDNQ